MMMHLSGGRYFGSKDCLKLVSVVTKLGRVENKANDESTMNEYDSYQCIWWLPLYTTTTIFNLKDAFQTFILILDVKWLVGILSA